MEELSVWLAFGAGFLSFISPCCLPLYPSYLSYITGISVAQLKDRDRSLDIKKNTMLHTLFFILGFSLLFYAIGFTASWIGNAFKAYDDLIRMITAVLLIAFGLFMLGIFQPSFLMREYKWRVAKKNVSYFSSFVVGIGFAAGWTPCIGPILGAIIAMAALRPEMGFAYLTAYILGFAIPFFIMAFFIGKTRWILTYSNQVMKIGGGLMVLFGVLLYTDQMAVIAAWLTQVTGFTGF